MKILAPRNLASPWALQISEKEEYSLKSSNKISYISTLFITKLRKLIRLPLHQTRTKWKFDNYNYFGLSKLKTWTYIWTQVDFLQKNSIKETIVAEHGHEKWMGLRDVISNVPAIDCQIAACISNIVLQRIDPIGQWKIKWVREQKYRVHNLFKRCSRIYV